MKIRLLGAGVLALSLIASPSQADVDVGIFLGGGAAIHGNGFSLYLGGPYAYVPFGYSRPRYAHPRRYHAPPRHYAPPRHHKPPRHHYRHRHYDRSPGYRHGFSDHGGRRHYDNGRSYRRSGAVDYRRTQARGAWRDGNRQYFRDGDRRRH
ncbi:hypothetical protein [Marinobacterium rhizophilum]|uniref:Uncharacterized protein n=1 Tax=Marinobacterium rhizophilum TaxID=420402 RepID=A0ABY5HKQ9_9GAMM|nr:hypothetical protein [Marinobacterium rhizophilum]UTW11541.1 hypothetical protein KDW95_20170 [Marinobacterium rhizophilum]